MLPSSSEACKQFIRRTFCLQGKPLLVALRAKTKWWHHWCNSTSKSLDPTSLYFRCSLSFTLRTCLPMGKETQCTKYGRILLSVYPQHIPLRTSSCPCSIPPSTSSSPRHTFNILKCPSLDIIALLPIQLIPNPRDTFCELWA